MLVSAVHTESQVVRVDGSVDNRLKLNLPNLVKAPPLKLISSGWKQRRRGALLVCSLGRVGPLGSGCVIEIKFYEYPDEMRVPKGSWLSINITARRTIGVSDASFGSWTNKCGSATLSSGVYLKNFQLRGTNNRETLQIRLNNGPRVVKVDNSPTFLRSAIFFISCLTAFSSGIKEERTRGNILPAKDFE